LELFAKQPSASNLLQITPSNGFGLNEKIETFEPAENSLNVSMSRKKEKKEKSNHKPSHAKTTSKDAKDDEFLRV